MSRVCSKCGKGTTAGNSRSHALNITKRVFRPNIHKTKVEVDGQTKTVYLCAKCMKTESKNA